MNINFVAESLEDILKPKDISIQAKQLIDLFVSELSFSDIEQYLVDDEFTKILKGPEGVSVLTTKEAFKDSMESLSLDIFGEDENGDPAMRFPNFYNVIEPIFKDPELRQYFEDKMRQKFNIEF